MSYFKVDVRKEPTEYGFMLTMQMYLLEEPEPQRDLMSAIRILRDRRQEYGYQLRGNLPEKE